MKDEWKDVPAEVRIHLCREDNNVYDDGAGQDCHDAPEHVAELLINYAPQGLFDLVFDLKCSGYHWPQTWDSPAEGDDCRELDSAWIDSEERIELPVDVQESLYGIYEEHIHEATLDFD